MIQTTLLTCYPFMRRGYKFWTAFRIGRSWGKSLRKERQLFRKRGCRLLRRWREERMKISMRSSLMILGLMMRIGIFIRICKGMELVRMRKKIRHSCKRLKIFLLGLILSLIKYLIRHNLWLKASCRFRAIRFNSRLVLGKDRQQKIIRLGCGLIDIEVLNWCFSLVYWDLRMLAYLNPLNGFSHNWKTIKNRKYLKMLLYLVVIRCYQDSIKEFIMR